MSSEQVIAEMRAMATGAHFVEAGLVIEWADRLSTPAAGGDDLLDRLDREAGAWESWNADYSDQPSECCVTSPPLLREAATTIRQLQARNAEQAFGLERSREAHADMELRYLTMRTKHTALLDGIEAAPVAEIDNSGDVTVLVAEGCGMDNAITAARIGALHGRRVYIISADKLALLRESSVPAIGEKQS